MREKYPTAMAQEQLSLRERECVKALPLEDVCSAKTLAAMARDLYEISSSVNGLLGFVDANGPYNCSGPKLNFGLIKCGRDIVPFINTFCMGFS